ncbi:hypothetical protein [Alcanivorax sp.]|uniref:hypothetical protein n=1 Tax=Alcanivorax sp. TaxID=1872427 RepID=UPI000C5F9736|nr:hypothetical protein [Alcanivorax sp.]MBQ26360.1 hypothetical protein [Alcanivorax sp.]
MSRIVMVMAVLVMVSACSSQQKQEIKDGGRQVGETTRDVTRDIGHATRDAARETGHFFRDTAKDIFGDGSADGNEEKAADDSDE